LRPDRAQGSFSPCYAAGTMPSEAAAPATDHGDLDSFLQGLLADTSKQLASMPKEVVAAAGDPLTIACARQQEHAGKRQAAAQLRMAAIDEQLSKDQPGTERWWKEQVRKRKEAEREEKARAEAAAAAAAAEAAAAEAAAASAAEAAKCLGSKALGPAAARELQMSQVVYSEEEQRWQKAEWEPLLEQHRAEARARRAAHEEDLRKKLEASASALQREGQAMAREDAAGKAFLAACADECRFQETMGEDSEAVESARIVLARRDAEQTWRFQGEERRRKAEEEEARRERERQEQDYREWREQVHIDRCSRLRLQERESPPFQDADHRRKLELQGRDFFRERELEQKALLEASLRNAALASERLKQQGQSPQSILEKTRELAERQRQCKKEQEPAKVEQELWETLLAKNRLSRQKERCLASPRWGVFAS